ncbi:MAG: phosphoglucosamine mutase, partial [Gemmatimonadetes bacterium]|nr:phosphoglucosamine mutase [Gemmatimonadota bacterium]
MPILLPDDLMVSVSGFRGRVGDALTPELVAGLAACYGAFLREEGDEGPVVVGRDSRTSGPMLMRAAVAGLLSVGCRVVELGVVPTPTLMLAVREGDAAGGLGVTASHNPAEWNALKFAVRGGTFLPPARMRRFQARVREREPGRALWHAIPCVERDGGAVDRHIERILNLSLLDTQRIRSEGMHVALDCGNGAGGVIMPELLSRLGCEVSAIGTEANGRFHRNPEPVAASLTALGELVRESGARIGLAVDPDVDRLSLVDEEGRALGEDLTLALAADVVLSRRPGSVVTNLSTSRVVDDVAESHGCRAIRAPVGEINVVERMIAEDAVVGGEGRGRGLGGS